MGLDVGVVKISYLERPRQPIYDFLCQLVYEVGDDGWGGFWEGNAFAEFEKRRLLSKARSYARKQGLSKEDSAKLLDWVRGLSWDRDTIMLHLNW